jgi:hypothetical protein
MRNMEIEIIPYQQVGAFHFNALRSQSREILVDHYDDLYCHARTDGKAPDDTYAKLGLEFIFTKYNRLGAIEMNAPAKPMFEGKSLLNMTWAELLVWFQRMDPELVVSDKDFISYKVGISAFAPTKNEDPNVLPNSITVFETNFFYQKIGIPNPALLNSFFIHVPYLETFENGNIEEETHREILTRAFEPTRENAFWIWNQLPIAFNYSSDLPQLIDTIAELLSILKQQPEGKTIIHFNCPSFACDWNVKWNDKFVLIDAQWQHIAGGFEAALNDEVLPTHQLTLLKSEFLAEWKVLLQQCVRVLTSKRVKMNDNDSKSRVKELVSLEKWIPNFGKFYGESQQWITTNADGRRTVNLMKLPYWKIALIILFVLAVVLLPIYYFNRGHESPFWALDGIIRVFLIVLVVTIPLTLFTARWLKKRNK